ncbi:PIN domain-containing protein [Paenibacillus chitinolyticus]|uniref:PIN domain-containing protein n=1 Tax=Paenibacillus chitinolyticus TaxID=79263 RepID=UPI00366F90EE
MGKETLHIFLDTTLTFEDPFFKKNYNRQLIHLAETHNIPIFMSRVVFQETRSKFESNVTNRMTALDKSLWELNKYHPTELNTEVLNCALKNFMQEFDYFYNDLIGRKVIQIIEYSNDILPVLVERSIKRIKPFGDKKQEFRDAIIWLSYVNYAESNDIENCFLLTNNLADFCENKIQNTLHPDLLEDSTRFKHYLNSADLLKNEDKIGKYVSASQDWMSTIIDSKYVAEMFENSLIGPIKKAFESFLEKIEMDDLLSADYYDYAYLDFKVGEVDCIGVNEIESKIVKEKIVVNGIVYVITLVTLSIFDDYGRGFVIDKDYSRLSADFKFTINENGIEQSSLEIEGFDVMEQANFDMDIDYYD